jgi:hypothetical protein
MAFELQTEKNERLPIINFFPIAIKQVKKVAFVSIGLSA